MPLLNGLRDYVAPDAWQTILITGPDDLLTPLRFHLGTGGALQDIGLSGLRIPPSFGFIPMNDCQQDVSIGDESSSPPHHRFGVLLSRPLRQGLGKPDRVHDHPWSQLVVDRQEVAR